MVALLEERFRASYRSAPSESELTAWKLSLAALGGVLDTPEFLASEVFVELRMPLSGRRCDVLLTGTDLAKHPSAVVVELKQWETARPSQLPEQVAIGARSSQHPCVQVRDYVAFLKYYHSAFTEGTPTIELGGCAYLHNMTDRKSIEHLRDTSVFGDVPKDYPLFTANDRSELVEWLAARLCHGDGAAVGERIANGVPMPSTKLLDVVARAVEGTFEWRLLDEQRSVFSAIRARVDAARANPEAKTVVIVRGGPGTGKSVLAIQLLGHGAKNGWRVVHSTGSQAFQTNLQGKTQLFSTELLKRTFAAKTKKSLPVERLFCTFADVGRVTTRNALDLVVADEAHRVWDFRRIKYPNGKVLPLSTVPLVREMIRATRVSAFFLDDNQAVRAEEIGRSQTIREMAIAEGAEVIEFDLNTQFRCGGSESYIHWVDALMGFRTDSDLAWREYDGYDFRVVRDMTAMDKALRAHRLAQNRCRIVAGYCWRWNTPVNGRPPKDITDKRFGEWSGAWIEKTGQGTKPLDNQYYRWANDDEYYEQVGSIYSVQGFEFDYVGVIWGEDLVRRNGQWMAQLQKNKDKVFKRDVRVAAANAAEMLRNVYRVLLTRGMKGTYVYVLDDETREWVETAMLG
ncbi:MAG: DUF2075 domain-containing protein [Myxococcales bacterium]|nr:DUF2075 domain-containing protein [Myxococcales bacterium]